MRTLIFPCLLALFLSSCSDTSPPSGEEEAALQQIKASEWVDVAASRQVSRTALIMKDRQAPIQHQQLALAISALVEDCVITQPVVSQKRSTVPQAEVRCANRLINQTLVSSGADRAYEVSLAAKSADPAWFVKVMPTYFDVD